MSSVLVFSVVLVIPCVAIQGFHSRLAYDKSTVIISIVVLAYHPSAVVTDVQFHLIRSDLSVLLDQVAVRVVSIFECCILLTVINLRTYNLVGYIISVLCAVSSLVLEQ